MCVTWLPEAVKHELERMRTNVRPGAAGRRMPVNEAVCYVAACVDAVLLCTDSFGVSLREQDLHPPEMQPELE